MSVISCIKAALRAIWVLPQECYSTQILNLPIWFMLDLENIPAVFVWWTSMQIYWFLLFFSSLKLTRSRMPGMGRLRWQDTGGSHASLAAQLVQHTRYSPSCGWHHVLSMCWCQSSVPRFNGIGLPLLSLLFSPFLWYSHSQKSEWEASSVEQSWLFQWQFGVFPKNHFSCL